MKEKNIKFDLQKFAEENNVIKTNNITTEVREIDFVSSFTKSMKALFDILSVSRPIQKQNGTKLVSKKATGDLTDGTSVAEGDVIPLSTFNVEPVELGEITLEKYRKAVTIESVITHGYENAIMMTDQQFKTKLRKRVLKKMFDTLLTGSITSTEANFQSAIALGIGRVQDAFEKVDKDITSLVGFVNPIDLAKHLGNTPITMQEVFGMNYVKNFLGIDTVFVTNNIPEGKVVVTAKDNLIVYYVNVASSDFSQMGLEFVTDADLPLIGFKTYGTYNRAQSEIVALMGIAVFPELIDCIAVMSIDGVRGLGNLTVKSTAGGSNKTSITIEEPKEEESNKYKYAINEDGTEFSYLENSKKRKVWKNWDGTSQIDATGMQGKTITVIEVDGSGQILAGGIATVTVG